jgi:hypothetical protein
MKPITKIVIFLVVAFALVIIIAAVRSNSVVAPVTTSPSPVTSGSPAASVSPVASASPLAMYTLVEVAKHKTATDCWTAVAGGVYNLTPFVSKHPGGVANITQVCGIDGTATFTQMHGSNQNAQKALASLKIGELK